MIYLRCNTNATFLEYPLKNGTKSTSSKRFEDIDILFADQLNILHIQIVQSSVKRKFDYYTA